MILQHGYLTNPTAQHEFDTPGKISLSQAFQESFDAQFKRGSVGLWVLFGLLGTILSTAIIGIAQFILGFNGQTTSTLEEDAFAIGGEVSEVPPLVIAVGMLLMLIGFFVSIYFTVGIQKGYIRGYDSGNPQLGDLFVKDFSVVGRMLLSSILVTLLSIAVTLPIVIITFILMAATGNLGSSDPTIPVGPMIFYVVSAITVNGIVSVLMYFYALSIVDSGVGAVESIKVSYHTAKKNFLTILGIAIISAAILAIPLIVLVLVFSLMGIAGAIIGAILAMAYVFVMYGPLTVVRVSAYRQAVGGPTATSVPGR